MDEARQAEEFSKELDRLLSGQRAGQDADAEVLKDLETAHRLASSDLSRESRVKESLRDELAKKGRESRLPRLFPVLSPRWGVAAAVACVAMLILAPLGIRYVFLPAKQAAKMAMGFNTMGSIFPDGASNYESGTAGLSPGSLVGQGTDVITPLNAPDPTAMVMGPGKTGKVGSVSAQYILPGKPKPKPKSPGHSKSLGESLEYLRGPMDAWDRARPEHDTEAYDHVPENPFRRVTDHPLSTFSIDVDAASYANLRRFLNGSRMPPADAVRIEEMVNYFRYDYPQPEGKRPFSITTELAESPWKPEHKLVHVGLQGKTVAKEDMPPGNLVFLIDSSGSMTDYNKLPLLKKAFRLLVKQLRDEDRISIVTYAGAAGLVLPSTPGSDKQAILSALGQLRAGGSTAGGAGIQLAYKVASENFIEKGNNRVILATDGDFNIGVTSDGDLVRIIEEKRKRGVFLTVLGFGMGNYKDSKMEKLADKGNGNYAYIDDIREARKVLVQEMGGTLLTIAKDVKLQIEFNPGRVQAYRLIGYENRILAAEDFNDDKKDAGELGAGHTVTALYEVVPAGVKMDLPGVDELKYQKTKPMDVASETTEMLTVKFRYKEPDGHKSKLIVQVLEDADRPLSETSENFRFSAAVAGFGMLLRGSKYAGNLTYKKIDGMARGALGADEHGYRSEFLGLVDKAGLLDDKQR